eukprot:6206731-Pleurochrysis_carterae.AAC.3
MVRVSGKIKAAATHASRRWKSWRSGYMKTRGRVEISLPLGMILAVNRQLHFTTTPMLAAIAVSVSLHHFNLPENQT